MKKPVWLARAVCLAIHEMVLSQHGGLAGVRDEGLLESALEKPPNLLAYGSPTLAELAASYAAGIILNHPFIDGNKRTAWVVARLSLRLNGVTLKFNPADAVALMLGVADGTVLQLQLAAWFRANTLA